MKYERMKMLRKEKKLSQEKIAELIDVSMNHYGKYERGEIDIPLNKAMALCDIFDVSLDYLVGWSDNRYNDTVEFKQKFLEKMKKVLDTI